MWVLVADALQSGRTKSIFRLARLIDDSEDEAEAQAAAAAAGGLGGSQARRPAWAAPAAA